MHEVKAKVKTALFDKTVDQKLAEADKVIDKITGNPDYDPAEVDLSDIIAKRDALLAARTARDAAKDAAKQRTTQLQAAEHEYDNAFRALVVDAEKHTEGDKDKLQGGGFDTFIPGARDSQGELPAPENVLARPGNAEGTMDVSWFPVEGARGYPVYITTDISDTESFTRVVIATTSEVVLTGLESGTKYYVRITAFGTEGESVPSDVTSSVAR